MKTGGGDFQSDVYSFGVLLADLLGYPAKLGKKKFDLEVFHKKADKDAPNDLVTLVKLCTSEDPSKRPTFSKVASGLTSFHQLFPNRPPLVDIDMVRLEGLEPAVCSAEMPRRRDSITKRKLRKTKSRSCELTASPVMDSPGRRRGQVVLEAPNFDNM